MGHRIKMRGRPKKGINRYDPNNPNWKDVHQRSFAGFLPASVFPMSMPPSLRAMMQRIARI